MKTNRIMGLVFALAFAATILALTLVVPPAASVHGQTGPGVAWEKEVWINGKAAPAGARMVEAGDIVEIVDRVWITNTNSLSLTLVASWTESLWLDHWQATSGQVETTTAQLEWAVEQATPNAWHVLTKTLSVLPGLWQTALITETLEVDLLGEEQRVVSLDYRAADLYLTKTVDPPNQVPTALVTYTLLWGNDGGWAPGVVISDTLPAEIVFVDATPPGVYNPLTHEVSWGPFDLDTGDRGEATIHGTIGADVLPNTLITNIARLIYAEEAPIVAEASHRSISPCVKVEGVAISMLSTPPFRPGAALQVLADLTPDDAEVPFRYQFVVDGVTGVTTGATTGDPLTLPLTIDAFGDHTVDLRVWNCNLTIGQYVSDSMMVTITPYRLYLPLLVRP